MSSTIDGDEEGGESSSAEPVRKAPAGTKPFSPNPPIAMCCEGFENSSPRVFLSDPTCMHMQDRTNKMKLQLRHKKMEQQEEQQQRGLGQSHLVRKRKQKKSREAEEAAESSCQQEKIKEVEIKEVVVAYGDSTM